MSNRNDIDRLATEYNYIRDNMEKVVRLCAILELPMFSHVKVRSLALVELYASKIKALLERGAARDLFDVHNMIQSGIFDETHKPMLRKGVIFYSAVGGNQKAFYSLFF